MKKIELKRVNNAVHLQATDEDGNIVNMDGSPEIGGENKGTRPMSLVLMALAGCTSMDVLSMLQKMRQEVIDYDVKVEGERAEEHPMVFTKIHVHYILKGALDAAKVEKAINYSMDKYCSVTHMLNKVAAITHSYEIIE
ncbi:MAG: OsmC family protein [Chitinophagales bacterium]|nr:OsmC family protein [Chitinophagales bacterium]